MNLRQKYKRLKQENARLKGQPAGIVIRTERYRVVGFVSERYYPDEIVQYRTENELKLQLMEDAIEELAEAVEFETFTSPYLVATNKVGCRAKIKIAVEV